MPLDTAAKNDIKFPEPDYLPLGNFKRGVITLVNQANLPKNALASALNVILVEDGLAANRPGIQWYGTIPQLPAPGTFSLTTAAGTTLGVGVYQYVMTFTNTKGETTASPIVSITTTASNTNVHFTGIPIGPGGTTSRIIYRTKVGAGTFFKLSTISDNTATTFTDNKADTALTVSGTPLTNTAQVSLLNGVNYFDTNTTTTDLVAVADGSVYRSQDNGSTWTYCSGYTLSTTSDVNMVQYNSFLYITSNSQDITVRYDGSTTLQTYTVLSTPAAATAVVSAALTGTTYTIYYKISAVSPVGFSIASSAVSVQTNKPRGNFDATSNTVTLTLPAYQGTQTRYDIYFSEDNLNFYYLDSQTTPNLTYVDNGSAILVPSTIAPTTNTTQGPTVAELSVVGNRLYGCRDKNYPYRIWFTSGTFPLGSFSNGYDGGYLDWQLGGKYFPVHVEDYRDGKGTNIATVWLNSADSQGATIQMSLGTLSVGNLSITVPSAYRLPGSRGTPAPRSVVNVLNDYHFYNSQAFYNLGNRPNLLQILSTDEYSANIRPTVRQINPVAESGICSNYYDGRIYISVPYGISTVNNATIVYDTELKAWLPNAYDKGFKQFLRYTSNGDGVHHLLAIKPGDNRLTEIGTLYTNSANIQGDYGQPFTTDLLTGLYSTTKNRYGFQYTEEMDYEFSNPYDNIYVELLGIDHAKGYGTVKKATLKAAANVANGIGWDSYAWDSYTWDYVAAIPVVFSEASTKRYTVVNRELNAVQWHISTTSLSARFILRSLQTWGTDTQDAHPSKWRITANT